jgi:MFS family permease
VRAGLVYLRGRRDVLLLLVVLAAGSMMAFRLEVMLPVLASRELHGGSRLYAFMTAIRGAGALTVSLHLASRVGPPSLKFLRGCAATLACSLALMAVPNTVVVMIAVFPVGLGMLGSIVATLSMTQLMASPEYRGRVVAVWFVVMNGGVVFGALLTGAVIEHLGSRDALLMGAASMAVVWLLLFHRREPADR